MAQKDWIEIIEKFNTKDKEFISNFLNSKDSFCPNENHLNIFDAKKPYSNFSSKNLNKLKPANWIPVYKIENLPKFMLENNLMPIRSGAGEFFFYKGDIFFDLTKIKFKPINSTQIKPIEEFVPLSLKVDFQKNENAFLNKALAFGIISHFVENDNLKVLNREIYNKNGTRLLYGQFGKIKTTFDLIFKTTKSCKIINSGFQFEIDLVLESEDEIFIFEAKSSNQFTKNFSLLQLYYPLIYLQFITTYRKKIRTIFIDITRKENKEIYRLVEIEFRNSCIDDFKVIKSFQYIIEDEKYILEDIISTIYI
jgi:hypothetical protein